MNDRLRKLYIEPTSKCNLACTMCFRNAWVGESLSDMSAEVFHRILETMPQDIETVFFGGMGEPLFHPDIVEMISSVRKRFGDNINIELLTNGTLLTGEMSDALLEAGLDKLWVSIENFDEAAYGEVRKGSRLSLITDNISAFNKAVYKYELKQRGELERKAAETKGEGYGAGWTGLGSTGKIRQVRLGLTFVLMRSNAKMLGELSRFARTYRASEVNISNALPTCPEDEEDSLYTKVLEFSVGTGSSRESVPLLDIPYMDFSLPEAQEGFAGLLRTDADIRIAGTPLARKRKYCRFVEEGNCFVRHDGDVSPCMGLLHSQKTWLGGSERTIYHYSFGNVKDEGLSEIWDSNEFSDFRERVREFSFSPCIGCGGCENRETNEQDCIGNTAPTCGACLWAEGIISCP